MHLHSGAMQAPHIVFSLLVTADADAFLVHMILYINKAVRAQHNNLKKQQRYTDIDDRLSRKSFQNISK